MLVGTHGLHFMLELFIKKLYNLSVIGKLSMPWFMCNQVKELGAVIYNCSCLASDMGKLFDVYWYLGAPGAVIPPSWPDTYSTNINGNTSMQIKYNGTSALTYLSVSSVILNTCTKNLEILRRGNFHIFMPPA